jgi:hypothetical protein
MASALKTFGVFSAGTEATDVPLCDPRAMTHMGEREAEEPAVEFRSLRRTELSRVVEVETGVYRLVGTVTSHNAAPMRRDE